MLPRHLQVLKSFILETFYQLNKRPVVFKDFPKKESSILLQYQPRSVIVCIVNLTRTVCVGWSDNKIQDFQHNASELGKNYSSAKPNRVINDISTDYSFSVNVLTAGRRMQLAEGHLVATNVTVLRGNSLAAHKISSQGLRHCGRAPLHHCDSQSCTSVERRY